MGEYSLRTLPQVVQDAAQRFGDQVAIQDGPVQMDYRELDRRRRRSAAAFLAAGVVRGDRIAIWAPNIYQWIIAAIGAQSLGVVLVPINTRWKGSEAAYALNMSRAKLLFTVGEFLGQSYPDLLVAEDLPHLRNTILLQGEAGACQS